MAVHDQHVGDQGLEVHGLPEGNLARIFLLGADDVTNVLQLLLQELHFVQDGLLFGQQRRRTSRVRYSGSFLAARIGVRNCRQVLGVVGQQRRRLGRSLEPQVAQLGGERG